MKRIVREMKRTLAILLAVAMVVALMPQMSMQVEAEENIDEIEAVVEETVSEAEVAYTILYDGNADCVNNLPENQMDCAENTVIIIPENIPTREGYIFNGWNFQKEGGEINYYPGDSIEIVQDIVLYAQWFGNVQDDANLYRENDITLQAVSTPIYNVSAALEYAKANVYNENDGLCAEFVSKCVRAGGLGNAIKTGTGGLWRELTSKSGLSMIDLKLSSNGMATKALDGDILAPGDVVMQWCYECNNGAGISPHALICSGYNSSGNALFYARNGTKNNETYKLSVNKALHPNCTNIGGKVIRLSTLESPVPAPVINSVEIININEVAGTYQVQANIASEAGLDRVQYPTWTEANGQDDLASNWSTNSAVTGSIQDLGNNTYLSTFTVSIADHNNERGNYATHVYAYDKNGKSAMYDACGLIDMSTGPIFDDVRINEVDSLKGSYKITAVFENNQNITKVQFPTWTEENGQDDLASDWENNPAVSAQEIIEYTNYTYYYYTVSISDHNNERGNYITHIYAYDTNGKKTCYPLNMINMGGAKSGTWGDNITWNLVGTEGNLELTISGTGEMKEATNLSTYNGADFYPWYYALDQITKITIEEGITSISQHAFALATNLVEISLPESITKIDSYAFTDCSSLSKDLTLPSGLNWIDGSAFLGTQIKKVYFTGNAPIYLLETDAYSKFSMAKGSVNEETRYSCEEISYVTIHEKEYVVFTTDASSFEEDAVLYYLPEKENWTTPEFKGYQCYPKPVDITALELEENNLELVHGETATLSPIISPADAADVTLIWKSSDTEVVTVDENGVVSAVAPGSAIVTVLTTDGKFCANCHVVVNDILVERVELSVSQLQIKEQSEYQLEATVYPENATNQTINWISSNTEIATVDEAGMVTAHSYGMVAIYAVAEDGGGEAECIISVQPKIRQIKLDRTDVTLIVGDETELIENILPQNAYDSEVIWTSSNEACVTVSEGKIVAIAEGSAIVTVTAKTDETVYAQCLVTVTPRQILEEDTPESTIPEGIWVAGIEDNMTYTGKAIKQSFRVYSGSVLLKEKVDYTVSYKNNKVVAKATDTKAPTITIKMKGNYTGKQVIHFNIAPVEISSENVSVDNLLLDYTGQYQTPIPTVKWNGKKLKVNKDFTITVSSQQQYKEIGNYKAVINGVGLFTGSREFDFTITDKKQLSKATIAKIRNYEYTGEAIKPELTVTYKGVEQPLVENKDYEVVYSDNVSVGTATVEIRALEGSDYAGSKVTTFKITGKNMKSVTVNNWTNSVVYTGQDIVLEGYQLSYKGTTLTENMHYTVSYSNNKNKGTATVSFTGIGEYTGTLKKKFTITAMPVTNGVTVDDIGTVKYVKGGAKPEPIVRSNGEVLQKGKDYTLSYKNNNSMNDYQKLPTVIVKGKGNYTGSLSVIFGIEKQDIGNLTIQVNDKAYKNKAYAYRSAPKVYDSNGKLLKAGVDYEKQIKYSVVDGNDSMIPNAGAVINVTVTGKGFYEGTIVGSYRIYANDISKAKVTITPCEYTGNTISLDETDITVTVGKGANAIELVCGKQYEIVGYSNNVKKGTAKVTIRGIGDYGGLKTISFKINPKKVSNWWEGLF